MNRNSNRAAKQEKLLEIMKEAKGNSLDIYYTLFEEFLKDDDEPWTLLRSIMEFPGRIGNDDGASEKIPQQVENEVVQEYKDYLFKTVKLLVEPNDTVEEFYEKLWHTVFFSPTFPESAEKRAVILKLLTEDIPILPYYQAAGEIFMDNDAFSEHVLKLAPRIQEAIHMLNRHFPQKTAESSQIIRIGEGLSKEDACVYWALVINMIRRSAYHTGMNSASTDKDTETDEAQGAQQIDL